MAQPSSASSQAPPAVPPGCKGLDDVDIVPDEGVSRVSRQLLEGCIRRTFTEGGSQVTRLIRQGADPRAIGGLRARGISGGVRFWRYSCLSFAIDSPTDRPFLYTRGPGLTEAPVVLPQWPSRRLQRDILNAPIDGGADVNAAGGEERPIKLAIAAGNLTAMEALLARQVDVRGFTVMQLPYIRGDGPPATRDYEAALMSVFRRLIQHDNTLAAERYGHTLVHLAARASTFSQSFIDEYLTLITSHGADMTATDPGGFTPLHSVAFGSHCVAEWLCRQLTAEDVNRGMPNLPNMTPLAMAAEALGQEQQGEGQGKEERHQRRIREHKATIGVLLRSGAAPSIARMPTATEEQRRRRQLVLAEYATVLNELSEVVLSAINGALAPQRDHSMLLARLLPLAPHHDGAHPHPSPSNMAFGPHEAEAIGWKIGAFLYEPPPAVAAINQYLIGESMLRRRVRAAVGHFVKSAATQTSSNREVVGGTRYQQQGDKRVKVTVPPLQCFAVRGSVGGRKTGVREVVHRARLDERRMFEWGQLGRLSRTGLFVSLGID
ncbi:unnamed protein product [Vitrella brassicaformis CCMP3155]|uniref:Uncharacterized protein n=1 Tax=Vitrella brassicaformis (strain CCMP3155) TaxID=1169540 RepID=A0A0G4GI15_VITBC|nr:unnamed protein product [Vitrella brassicaformis CCMP3155]|eukprot:CEM29373.1 unnamed protein product [Vitrella brassicaformis CCMP3155]